MWNVFSCRMIYTGTSKIIESNEGHQVRTAVFLFCINLLIKNGKAVMGKKIKTKERTQKSKSFHTGVWMAGWPKLWPITCISTWLFTNAERVSASVCFALICSPGEYIDYWNIEDQFWESVQDRLFISIKLCAHKNEARWALLEDTCVHAGPDL